MKFIIAILKMPAGTVLVIGFLLFLFGGTIVSAILKAIVNAVKSLIKFRLNK